MMFCHGSSWFVMVHVMVHDVSLSWFRHGSSWFVMVHCHGSLSWFVMVHCHGSSWFVMVHCHGSLSWFTVMVRHGSLSWFTVMVRHGSLSWFTVMVRHGCHGCHGSLSWFVMVRDVLFSKILQKRSCDPQFSQSESQIHYQISFLMRLLIFPFPFKEHTSKELC